MLNFLQELNIWLVDFVGVLLVEALVMIVEPLVHRDHHVASRRLEAVLQTSWVLVVVAVQRVLWLGALEFLGWELDLNVI